MKLNTNANLTPLWLQHDKFKRPVSPDNMTSASSEGTEASFAFDGEIFVKGNIAVHPTGVVMRGHPTSFTVVHEELSTGDIIGRGASSTVRAATHMPSSTRLALKHVNVYDKARRDELVREITLLYDSAACPSLVRFYGAFYREGTIRIALEYMDGGSLANVVRQVGARGVPERVLAAMAFQVLWGLAHLKHRRRLHRDLKPSNLLINSAGRVKLSDFGISTELQSSIAMCSTFVGTFKYMSPERIRHAPYGHSADIWSAGVSLAEVALGAYPFPGARTHFEVMQCVLDGDVVAPCRGVVSEACCEWIGSCCDKDPAKRLPADILLGSPWLQQHGVQCEWPTVPRVPPPPATATAAI